MRRCVLTCLNDVNRGLSFSWAYMCLKEKCTYVCVLSWYAHVRFHSCVCVCACLTTAEKVYPPSRCAAPRPAGNSSRSFAPLSSPTPPRLRCSPWWCWGRQLGGWSVNTSHLENKLICVGGLLRENNISIKVWLMLTGERFHFSWCEAGGGGDIGGWLGFVGWGDSKKLLTSSYCTTSLKIQLLQPLLLTGGVKAKWRDHTGSWHP